MTVAPVDIGPLKMIPSPWVSDSSAAEEPAVSFVDAQPPSDSPPEGTSNEGDGG